MAQSLGQDIGSIGLNYLVPGAGVVNALTGGTITKPLDVVFGAFGLGGRKKPFGPRFPSLMPFEEGAEELGDPTLLGESGLDKQLRQYMFNLASGEADPMEEASTRSLSRRQNPIPPGFDPLLPFRQGVGRMESPIDQNLRQIISPDPMTEEERILKQILRLFA